MGKCGTHLLLFKLMHWNHSCSRECRQGMVKHAIKWMISQYSELNTQEKKKYSTDLLIFTNISFCVYHLVSIDTHIHTLLTNLSLMTCSWDVCHSHWFLIIAASLDQICQMSWNIDNWFDIMFGHMGWRSSVCAVLFCHSLLQLKQFLECILSWISFF